MSLPEVGTVDVVAVYLPAHDPARLLRVLSTEEQKRADRFKFAEDKSRYIVSHAVLRLQIAAYLNTDPHEIVFEHGVHGKPYISSTALRFNLSHAGQAAAMAFTTGLEVGVDVESFRRRLSDLEGVARRFFSEPEFQAYLTAPDRRLAFFRIWTRKEAFIKATGEGMQRRLSSFVVSAGVSPQLLSVDGAEAQRWTMYDATPFAGHLLAVAVESPDAIFHLRQTNFC